MTKSLVTGGSGFTGSHLARALRARGDDVIILDVDDHCPVDGIDFRHVDITDEEAVLKACQGVDVIFHNTSFVQTKQIKGDLTWSVNLGGTENLLRAAQHYGIPRFVYVSSAGVVYEGKDIENGDESLPYASISISPYIDSKIAAEKAVLAANGSQGVATVAIRPHIIFGPDDRRFIPGLIERMQSGRMRYQIGRGTWLSDFTYVGNLVDGLLLADHVLIEDGADSLAAGQAYFVTNGEPMPFWDFVKKVASRLGLPSIQFRMPYGPVYGIAAMAEWIDSLRGGNAMRDDAGLTRFAIRYMVTHHYYSIDRARRELGYTPAISIEEGIELTCKYLEETGPIS